MHRLQRLAAIAIFMCCCPGCDSFPKKQATERERALWELIQEETKAEEEERLSLIAIKYGLSVAQMQSIIDAYESEHHPAMFHLGQEMRLKKSLPLLPKRRGETVPETIERLASEQNISSKIVASVLLDLETLNTIKQIEQN